MATPAEMVTTLEAAIAATPAGTAEIEVDGRRVRYDRQQLVNELEYWRRRAAAADGTRPRCATINLRNSF
jgi:hypothetical protein